MAVAVPHTDYAQLLLRTTPFREMASASRIRLLSQSRSARFLAGELIFALNEVPTEVFLVLEGRVCLFGDFNGEPEPVLLHEVGPGACLGWTAALAGDTGLHAMATSEVRGLLVPAPTFVEIGRFDPELKAAFFARAWKAEVWRALLSETERCLGELRSVREVVDALFDQCIVRDWPEEEAAPGYSWVVAGGEGAPHGARWNGGDGVLWARLLGFPEEALAAAMELLAHLPPAPAKPTAEPDLAVIHQPDRPAEPRKKLPISSFPSGVRLPPPLPATLPATSPKSDVDEFEDDFPEVGSTGMRSWPLVALAFLLAVASTAWWASTQPVVQPVIVKGKLVFRGQTRPLPATVNGTLTEFRVSSGQRIKRGEALAIVQPPIDEKQLHTLEAAAAKARAAVEFSAAVLAGQAPAAPADARDLADLARELAREQSNVRIQNAAALGRADAPELTSDERREVIRQIAKSQESRNERLDSANRDASLRREDLTEAEQSLREAQDEVRLTVQSFAGNVTENKKEAAQEMADHRRALSVLQRQVAQRLAVVNRLRKEIASIEAEPVAAEPLPTVNNAELDRARRAVTTIAEKLRAQSEAAHQQIAASETAIAKLKAEGAPRQVLIRQSGRITEAAKLEPGAQISADMVLAKFVTQDVWQIELNQALPAKVPVGTPVRLAVAGETGPVIEPLHYSDATRTRLRLGDEKREWRDGAAVILETTVVKGTLLEQWLGQL